MEPLTTAQAKAHLRVDISDDDTLIDAIILAARKRLETDSSLALITQTLEMTLDCFPPGNCPIQLKRPPLQSVTSIKYIDTDGVEQTWSSSLYRVDTASRPSRITPAYDESYPSTREVTGAVTIRFVAGYGDASTNVPEDLIQALKMLIGHFYENREDVITGTISSQLPHAYKWLTSTHKAKDF